MSSAWEVVRRFNGGVGGASVCVQSYLTPQQLIELAVEITRAADVGHGVPHSPEVVCADRGPSRVAVQLTLDDLRAVLGGRVDRALREKFLTAAGLLDDDVDLKFDKGEI